MFIHWLRNRFIFTAITSAVIIALVGGLFLATNIKNESLNNSRTSTYEKSDIDYDIPSPSKSQLASISELDFVDNVFGYYYTESSVSCNGNSKTVKILYSDCMDSVDFTMYNSDRLISESDEQLDNPIYVDYDFATELEVEVSDEVVIDSIAYQIGGIYETNMYNHAILIPLVGEQKEFIESRVSNYSGAYIAVNDVSAAEAYWRDYKPEGRLKNPEDFDSREAYETHYNGWNSASYYNEITSFSGKLENVGMAKTYDFKLIVAIYSVATIAVNLVLFLRKSERVYFGQKKSKRGITSYYVKTLLLENIVTIAGLYLIVSNAVKSCEVYVSEAIYSKISIIMVVICVVVSIIEFVVNRFVLVPATNKS